MQMYRSAAHVPYQKNRGKSREMAAFHLSAAAAALPPIIYSGSTGFSFDSSSCLFFCEHRASLCIALSLRFISLWIICRQSPLVVGCEVGSAESPLAAYMDEIMSYRTTSVQLRAQVPRIPRRCQCKTPS